MSGRKMLSTSLPSRFDKFLPDSLALHKARSTRYKSRPGGELLYLSPCYNW